MKCPECGCRLVLDAVIDDFVLRCDNLAVINKDVAELECDWQQVIASTGDIMGALQHVVDQLGQSYLEKES